jgi:hypothetical protein
MVPQRYLLALVISALALPVVVTVIAGAALLLGGLGDETGAAVLRFFAVGAGAVWLIGLVALVLILAVQALGCRPSPGPDPKDRGEP